MKKLILITIFLIVPFIVSAGETDSRPYIMFFESEVTIENAAEAAVIVDLLVDSLDRTGAIQAFTYEEMTEARENILNGNESYGTDLANSDGKLRAADFMVLSSLAKVGSRYMLSAKMISVESEEILSTVLITAGSLQEFTDSCTEILKALLEIPDDSESVSDSHKHYLSQAYEKLR